MEDIYDDEKGLQICTTEQKIGEQNSILFFRVIGSIDTHTCSIHLLDNVISNKVEEPHIKNVAFNLSELHHINSTGIGFFMKLAGNLEKEKQGKIYITDIDEEKTQLFDMLGLWRLFIRVNSDDDVIKECGG